MPTSATGISTSNRARGFTLVEILVVVVIIGIMAVGALLSLSSVGGDRGLQNETDRLLGLMSYAREQAEMQNREYGLRLFEGGYEFMTLDRLVTPAKWERVQGDDALRRRLLPEDLTLAVRVDGRLIVLPKKPDDKSKKIEDLKPQAMLLSSGELNGFELLLNRPATGKGSKIAVSESETEIEASEQQTAAR